MFTMFAAPRPFEDLHQLWQENAIASWTMLKPRPRILLFGNERGIAKIAKKYGCEHIRHIDRNKWGTPLVGSLFSKAQALATTPLLCYSNADIIYTQSLIDATKMCSEAFEEFLLVGKRFDSNIRHKLLFKGKWQKNIWEYAIARGRHHSLQGEDYFVFTKGLFTNVPQFALGRSAWDNWLVFDVTKRGLPTIDGVAIIRAIHQGKSKRKPLPRDEYRMNQRIWFENGGIKDAGYTSSALWVLTKDGFKLRKKRGRWQ